MISEETFFLAQRVMVNSDQRRAAVIGGHDGQQQLAHVETAALAKDGSVGNWLDGPALNLSRSACTAVIAKHTVLVIGGAHQDAPVASVEALRIVSP